MHPLALKNLAFSPFSHLYYDNPVLPHDNLVLPFENWEMTWSESKYEWKDY